MAGRGGTAVAARLFNADRGDCGHGLLGRVPRPAHEQGSRDQLLLQIRGVVAEYERSLIESGASAPFPRRLDAQLVLVGALIDPARVVLDRAV